MGRLVRAGDEDPFPPRCPRPPPAALSARSTHRTVAPLAGPGRALSVAWGRTQVPQGRLTRVSHPAWWQLRVPLGEGESQGHPWLKWVHRDPVGLTAGG